MRTPDTAAPVVESVARPIIFCGTGVGPGGGIVGGVGLGAGVVGGVALGVSVGVETEVVAGATVGVGSRVR